MPQLLLQPLPGCSQKLEHPGFLDRQHGLPLRAGRGFGSGIVNPYPQRLGGG